MVPSVSSIPQVSNFVVSSDPFLSCTAAVPSAEDKFMTEDEARDLPSDRPARITTSLQEPH